MQDMAFLPRPPCAILQAGSILRVPQKSPSLIHTIWTRRLLKDGESRPDREQAEATQAREAL